MRFTRVDHLDDLVPALTAAAVFCITRICSIIDAQLGIWLLIQHEVVPMRTEIYSYMFVYTCSRR